MLRVTNDNKDGGKMEKDVKIFLKQHGMLGDDMGIGKMSRDSK